MGHRTEMGLKLPPSRFFFPFLPAILPFAVFPTYTAYSFFRIFISVCSVCFHPRSITPQPCQSSYSAIISKIEAWFFLQDDGWHDDRPRIRVHACNHAYIEIGRSLCKMAETTIEGCRTSQGRLTFVGRNSINQYSNTLQENIAGHRIKKESGKSSAMDHTKLRQLEQLHLEEQTCPF